MFTRKKLEGAGVSLILCCLIFLTGCGGAYKASGQYKRDILLDRIDKARECHQRAQEQFETVLAKYSDIMDANSGNIRVEYNKFAKECKKANALSKDVAKRVKDIEAVGKPLFRTWEDELSQYQNEQMRRSSEEQLDKTRSKYLKLVHSLKSTDKKMSGVLSSVNDQMLFLSHNLNKKALAAFKQEVATLQLEVKDLVKQMDNAINEVETFMSENGKVVLAVLEDESESPE